MDLADAGARARIEGVSEKDWRELEGLIKEARAESSRQTLAWGRVEVAARHAIRGNVTLPKSESESTEDHEETAAFRRMFFAHVDNLRQGAIHAMLGAAKSLAKTDTSPLIFVYRPTPVRNADEAEDEDEEEREPPAKKARSDADEA